MERSPLRDKQVETLLDNVPEVAWRCQRLLLPTSWDADLVPVLKKSELFDFDLEVVTNDDNNNLLTEEYWEDLGGVDWVVSMPDQSTHWFVLPHAFRACKEGMAFLTNLHDDENWEWFSKNPPTHMIVLAPPSEASWFVWDKHAGEGIRSRIRFVMI